MRVFLTLIFILLLHKSWSQQQVRAVQTIDGNLNSLLNLRVEEAKPLNFVFSSVKDYEDGKYVLEGLRLRVAATRTWALFAKANTTYFYTNSTNVPPMPSNVLSLKEKNLNRYLPLTSTIGTVPISVGQRGDEDRNEVNIDYYMNPGFNYAPGFYSIDITYTLTPY